MVGGSDELDEVAVGVLDYGESNFAAGNESRSFGKDLDSGFFEALEGDLGAVHMDGEVAEAKAAGDIGLIALFAFIDLGLHELDGGGSLTFAEGELLNDDFFAGAETGFLGHFLSGGEFSGGGEADRFGVELHRFIEVAHDDAEIDGGGAELGFVGGSQ